MNNTPNNIFISYRRSDTLTATGRLYDELIRHFDEQRIFRDIDNIDIGEDFVNAIEDKIKTSKALIVVIGPEWLTAADDTGRRLDNPHDFTRLEIAAALRSQLWVIPVLVEGANMPLERDLPDDIKGLARRQAFQLSDLQWRRDVAELIRRIDEELWKRSLPKSTPYLRIVITVLILLLISLVFMVFVDRDFMDPKMGDEDAEPIINGAAGIVWYIGVLFIAGDLGSKWRSSRWMAYATVGLVVGFLNLLILLLLPKHNPIFLETWPYVTCFLSSVGLVFLSCLIGAKGARNIFKKKGL